jgi:hypothetical protein
VAGERENGGHDEQHLEGARGAEQHTHRTDEAEVILDRPERHGERHRREQQRAERATIGDLLRSHLA